MKEKLIAMTSKQKLIAGGVIAIALVLLVYFLIFTGFSMADVDKAFAKGDNAKAVEMLNKMVERGDTAAFTRIYDWYSKHNDKSGISRVLRVAAQKEMPKAMNLLGQLMWKQDSDSAKYWLKKAAETEIQQYIFEYADYCRVTKDRSEFFKWMEKAAKGKDKEIAGNAYTHIGMAYTLNDNDDEKAIPYLEKGGKLGNSDAQLYLASIYHDTKKDDEKFIYLATQAMNNPKSSKENKNDALRYIANNYIEKKQFKDLEQLVEKGIAKGIPHAQFIKGVFYLTGNEELGIKEDDDQARQWFLKAANEGHDMAAYNLAMMSYEDNNIDESYKYMEMAAKNGNKKAEEMLQELKIVYPSELTNKAYTSGFGSGSGTYYFESGGKVTYIGQHDYGKWGVTMRWSYNKAAQCYFVSEVLALDGTSYSAYDFLGERIYIERDGGRLKISGISGMSGLFRRSE